MRPVTMVPTSPAPAPHFALPSFVDQEAGSYGHRSASAAAVAIAEAQQEGQCQCDVTGQRRACKTEAVSALKACNVSSFRLLGLNPLRPPSLGWASL